MIITDLNKKSRKMQFTINNPQKETTTPQGKGLNTVKDVKDYIDGIGVVKEKDYYCFSFEKGLKEETPHIHIFFSFKSPRYGKVLKEFFPTAHIEYCVGKNSENRDYIYKTGKWEGDEKEGTRIEGMQYENREIPEDKCSGKRTDLETIKELINQGLKPREILEINPNNYRHEKYIFEMYYNKRCNETPIKRDISVTIHTGVAGSGKTNVLQTLSEQDLFIGADYSSALFDNYEGQDILFLDEFRGQIPYNQLLIILDGYKMPIHARYSNKYSLWTDVHITSVIPIEEWYNNDNIRDTFEQLKRRVTKITYHYMTCGDVFIPNKMEFLKNHRKEEIQYHEYTVISSKYDTYEKLEKEALEQGNVNFIYNSDLESNNPFEDDEIPTTDDLYREWLDNNFPFGWTEQDYKDFLDTFLKEFFHNIAKKDEEQNKIIKAL